MSENTLLFELPDDPIYVNGFEAGMIWQKIQDGEVYENHPFHTANKEIITRMCETFNCDFDIVEHDETWCYLTIRPTKIF